MGSGNNIRVLTKEVFTKAILTLMEEKRLSAIEAIVHYAEREGVEIETVSRLVDKTMKERLESEASKLRLLKNTEALPI
jgi:hypothetical protein